MKRVALAALAVVLLSSSGRTLVVASRSAEAFALRMTYARDIAPLIVDRCGVCHHPGGSAPFSLLTYTDVKRHAAQIATVTKSRFMPPWKADPADGPFVGQHPLTSADIHLIQQWVDEGAAEGDPRDMPAPRTWTEEWQLGKPDVVVTLPQAYTLPAEGTDVFHIFVLPIPVDGTRFVRGLEFRPGNARVVHHANIRIDRTPASRRLDEADPGPGYGISGRPFPRLDAGPGGAAAAEGSRVAAREEY
jgi:hypothetical protein